MQKSRARVLFVLLLALVTIFFCGRGIVDALSMVGRNDGYEPIQPIAYSHKVHAGDFSIPCLYCHYGAERSRHAGVPAASVCMNCHNNIRKDSPEIQKVVKAIEQNRPIEWLKVNRMADFVYFSHEQHVSLGKIVCQTCHGPVETMARVRQVPSLTMGWCIDCHRKSDVVVHGTLQTQKVSEVGGLDCGKCHY